MAEYINLHMTESVLKRALRRAQTLKEPKYDDYMDIDVENGNYVFGNKTKHGDSLGRTITIGDGNVTAYGAIQIGTGTNSKEDTVQINDTTILDKNGKIPLESLAGTVSNSNGFDGVLETEQDVTNLADGVYRVPNGFTLSVGKTMAKCPGYGILIKHNDIYFVSPDNWRKYVKNGNYYKLATNYENSFQEKITSYETTLDITKLNNNSLYIYSNVDSIIVPSDAMVLTNCDIYFTPNQDITVDLDSVAYVNGSQNIFLPCHMSFNHFGYDEWISIEQFGA